MNKIVAYEGWQMECCGTPFKVGDFVEWTVEKPEATLVDYDNPADHCDYIENHHSGGVDINNVSRITGQVISIQLVYVNYVPKSTGSKVYLPGKKMTLDSQVAEQWNDDINGYEFYEFLVMLKSVKLSTISTQEYEKIFKY